MLTPHGAVCHKEPGLPDSIAKDSLCWKVRGRVPSDELSTAAPSPEASPLFGPQSSTPFCGPGELLLPEAFELPDAQDSREGSEAEFELSGFEDADACPRAVFELLGLDDEEDATTAPSEEGEEGPCHEAEDVETELLSLLAELSSLRAEARDDLARQECGSLSDLQKIPYPELESGFLPAQFLPTSSWLLPAGRAETGKWACAMAPRPSGMGMEPVNICFGTGGAVLEVAPPCSDGCAQESPFKAKAVFRRARGRSRSPLAPPLERCLPQGRARGRSRRSSGRQ